MLSFKEVLPFLIPKSPLITDKVTGCSDRSMFPLHHPSCKSTTLLHCQFISTAPEKVINPITSAKGWRQWRPCASQCSPHTACSLSWLVLVNELRAEKNEHKEKFSLVGETSSNLHSYWATGSVFRQQRPSKLSIHSSSSSRRDHEQKGKHLTCLGEGLKIFPHRICMAKDKP